MMKKMLLSMKFLGFAFLSTLAGILVVHSAETSDGWMPLFNGKNLDGWVQINGTASYTVEDGTILGKTAEGSPNSFLCTIAHYSDFELEFEVLVDTRLNSGVQFRSNSMPEYKNGRVHGYQVEIATNGSAGNIYDEGRRGRWLLNKTQDGPNMNQAFKDGEWNHFRVLCVGNILKTWVNGQLIANITDDITTKGFIGLQVHAFQGDSQAWVKWRNIRIRDLTK